MSHNSHNGKCKKQAPLYVNLICTGIKMPITQMPEMLAG